MKDLGQDINREEIEGFKKATIEMFDNEWSPKDFAEELYGNPHLTNEFRTILTIYLSDKLELNNKVRELKGSYED